MRTYGKLSMVFALVGASLVASGAQAVGEPSTDGTAAWAHEGHDAAGSSWNPDEHILTTETVRDVAPLWRAPAAPQGGGSIEGTSEVVVAGGWVFVQDNDQLHAYEADGCDSRRCDPIWTFEGQIDGGTPAFTGGSLLVAQNPLDQPTLAVVHALDPATGDERWRVEFPTPQFVGGSNDVVVEGDFGYMTIGEEVRAYAANGCGADVCSALWTVRIETEFGFLEDVHVLDDTLYIEAHIDETDQILAFDAAGCGEPLCTVPLWQTTQLYERGWVVSEAGLFVADFDRRVLAFPSDGCGSPVCSPLWSTTDARGFQDDLAVTDELLVAGAGGTTHVYDVGGCAAPPCAPLWSAVGTGWGVSVAGDLIWAHYVDERVYGYALAGCGAPTCSRVTQLTYRESKHASCCEGRIVVVDGLAYVHYITGIVVFGLPRNAGP